MIIKLFINTTSNDHKFIYKQFSSFFLNFNFSMKISKNLLHHSQLDFMKLDSTLVQMI